MARISKKEAFNLGLPKWPQFLITGKKVTEEQAFDIIRRTDSFVIDLYGYAGGNNHKWNEWAQKTMGTYDLIQMIDKYYKPEFDRSNGFNPYEISSDFENDLQFVRTDYLRNSWMSCAFIYGPHGWCHPDGTISYIDNVGKWPSVEEIYEELKKIQKAFPYLELTGTLMDGESCEDNTKPIVTFVLKNGKMFMTDEHEKYHFETTPADRSDDAITKILTEGREQGLPNSWVVQFGNLMKPAVEKAHQKMSVYFK